MNKRKNILICPLEWGLGHASRMIPVASELLKLNHNVTFASGKEHMSLINSELPGCACLEFPGFNPGYSRYLPQYLSLIFKIPQLVYHIILEHSRLKQLIKEHSIDIVISDNRFGLWNRKVKTVYVTHMLRIPFPEIFRFLEPAGVFIHRQIIRKYDYCLIPDLPGEINLSGRLSHGIRLPENVLYAGILSRFSTTKEEYSNSPEPVYNTVILSGPEPQRSMLKKKLSVILGMRDTPTVILEGRPGGETRVVKEGNLVFYNHLSAGSMKYLLLQSKGIISRSGYSTIMDLVTLNCNALLIPTPGQTEQEYLAGYLSRQGLFSYIKQSDVVAGLSFPEKTFPDYSTLIRTSHNLLIKALIEISE